MTSLNYRSGTDDRRDRATRAGRTFQRILQILFLTLGGFGVLGFGYAAFVSLVAHDFSATVVGIVCAAMCILVIGAALRLDS